MNKKFFNKFLSIIAGDLILTLEDIERIQHYSNDNELELIKSIFEVKKIRPFSLPCKTILNFSADKGHVEIIQYLLSSPCTKEFKKTMLNEPLILASLNKNEGGTKIVKYILSSKELRKNIDMSKLTEHVLSAASQSMNLSTIKFVLEDKELSSYINIHHNHDELFKYCFYFKEINFLNYLIFDRKITKTKDIDELLENPNNNNAEDKYQIENIKNMFDRRQLNKDLKQELKISGDNTKRMKI